MTRGDALDAERAVCGCLLGASLAVARELMALLVTEDFTEPRHRAVFDAARSCVDRGVAPDPVIVLEVLKEQGNVMMGTASSSAGPYLHSLLQAPPSLGSGSHYAKIVRRESYLRRVQQAGERIEQAAGGGSVEVAIDVVRAEWMSLAAFTKRLGLSA